MSVRTNLEITIEQTCCLEGSMELGCGNRYLLFIKENDFSTFHRLNNDECWHFYAGGSLALFIIENDGSLQRIILGNNIAEKEVPQFVIKAGKWFAAAPCAPTPHSVLWDVLWHRDSISMTWNSQTAICSSLNTPHTNPL